MRILLPMAFEREELRRHVANSRAVRRRVVRAALAIAAVALVLLVTGAGTRWWLGTALLAAIVGGSGVWITHGHIAEFERLLREPTRLSGRPTPRR